MALRVRLSLRPRDVSLSQDCAALVPGDYPSAPPGRMALGRFPAHVSIEANGGKTQVVPWHSLPRTKTPL